MFLLWRSIRGRAVIGQYRLADLSFNLPSNQYEPLDIYDEEEQLLSHDDIEDSNSQVHLEDADNDSVLPWARFSNNDSEETAAQ